MLELRSISHAFGDVEAVHNLDLVVETGQVLCLLGPSGCGKTTALRIAAGLEPVQTGEVLINDKRVAGNGAQLPPESRSVGLVFQDFALFPHMTIADNVAFGLGHLGQSQRRERVHEVLTLVGMEKYTSAYPHMLSGGQQQRIALARAIAPNPSVLLLDEPFSGLDARLRTQVRDDTLHILKASGTTSLVVTHDPEEAMFMGDQVAVMNAGSLEQVGPPDEIYFSPRSAFVAEFLSDVNRLTGYVHDEEVQTALGPIAASGFADDTMVEVLVRPEAILIHGMEGEQRSNGSSLGGHNPTAKVIESRLLGRTSLIHLSILNGQGKHHSLASDDEAHLHARVPGRYLPKSDTVVGLAVDRSQAFVFATEKLT